jgi:hypothetical protein
MALKHFQKPQLPWALIIAFNVSMTGPSRSSDTLDGLYQAARDMPIISQLCFIGM